MIRAMMIGGAVAIGMCSVPWSVAWSVERLASRLASQSDGWPALRLALPPVERLALRSDGWSSPRSATWSVDWLPPRLPPRLDGWRSDGWSVKRLASPSVTRSSPRLIRVNADDVRHRSDLDSEVNPGSKQHSKRDSGRGSRQISGPDFRAVCRDDLGYRSEGWGYATCLQHQRMIWEEGADAWQRNRASIGKAKRRRHRAADTPSLDADPPPDGARPDFRQICRDQYGYQSDGWGMAICLTRQRSLWDRDRAKWWQEYHSRQAARSSSQQPSSDRSSQQPSSDPSSQHPSSDPSSRGQSSDRSSRGQSSRQEAATPIKPSSSESSERPSKKETPPDFACICARSGSVDGTWSMAICRQQQNMLRQQDYSRWLKQNRDYIAACGVP